MDTCFAKWYGLGFQPRITIKGSLKLSFAKAGWEAILQNRVDEAVLQKGQSDSGGGKNQYIHLIVP